MAYKQQDTTFLGFIEEYFKVPVEFPKKIYALYIENKTKALTLTTIRSTISNETETSFISTFSAGGFEALKDIKGISTTVSGEQLVKDPLKTIKTLGNKTLEQIFALDEVSSDIRSDIIEGLTKGKLSAKGRVLTEPQSLVVKNLGRLGLSVADPEDLIIRPTVAPPPGAGPGIRSAIQLLGTPTLAAPTIDEQNEDRQILEQNKSRDLHYKAYRDLGGKITALSGYMENDKSRQQYYTESIIAHNRAIMSELGVNLDDVLKIKNRRSYDPSVGRMRLHDSDGSFYAELNTMRGGFPSVKENLENLLGDDTRLRKALNLHTPGNYNDAIWANLDPASKDFVKDTLKSEFINQGFYTSLKDSSGKTALDADLGTALLGGMARQRYLGKASDLQEGIIDREKNRSALEAEVKAILHKPNLVAKISEAAKIQAEKQALEGISASLGLSPGSITNLTDARIPATVNVAQIRADIATAQGLARDRFESAQRAAKISSNLFFAASMNRFLESVEKGNYMETILISSRLIGMLPFISSKLGSPGEYSQLADKLGIPGTKINVGNVIAKGVDLKNAMMAATGLAFEDVDDVKNLPLVPKIAGKLTGGLTDKAFEAGVWVEWRRETPAGVPDHWTQARIKPSSAGGLFGEWGLHDTLHKAWGESGLLLTEAGFPNPALYSPNKLLENIDNTKLFFENLRAGAENVITTGVANTHFEKLAHSMGLTEFLTDSVTGYPAIGPTGLLQYQKLDLFKNQLGKLTNPADGGFSLLEMLSNPDSNLGTFPLEGKDRWDFLLRIIKEKKAGHLVNKLGNEVKFIGLLNRFNRAANAAYVFFYRELIGGGYAGNNLIFKVLSKILKPLRGLGFADETLIASAVQKVWIIQWFNKLSTNLYSLANKPALATGAIGKFLSVGLKSLGFLTKGVGGLTTGGIAYLLSSVGEMGVSFVKTLFTTRDIRLAIKGVFGVIKTKIRTLNKIVIGIVLTGCSCLALPLAFIIVIVGMVAPLEDFLGGGAYEDLVVSKKIRVTKEDSYTPGSTSIAYSIRIENTTGTNGLPAEVVHITAFNDQLKYSKPEGDCGIVDVASAPSQTYGSVTLPTIDSLTTKELVSGQSMVVGPINLTNIKTTSGTYINTVEVEVAEDAGKKAASSVSTKIGQGGCAQCPTGWPTVPFTLTQGTFTYDSHSSAEALDLASGANQPIRATHNGVLYVGLHSACEGSSCDYGNYVKVLSPSGFETIYAHMNGFASGIANGQVITGGEEIGYIGSTGNSTGPHLHYEFVNTNLECIPGKPLRMRNVNDSQFPGSYIPESIPVPHCVGSASCRMQVDNE